MFMNQVLKFSGSVNTDNHRFSEPSAPPFTWPPVRSNGPYMSCNQFSDPVSVRKYITRLSYRYHRAHTHTSLNRFRYVVGVLNCKHRWLHHAVKKMQTWRQGLFEFTEIIVSLFLLKWKLQKKGINVYRFLLAQRRASKVGLSGAG